MAGYIEYLGRLNKIIPKIKQPASAQEPPYICDMGCIRFVKGALFTFYHFAVGSLAGVLLINEFSKMLK